MPMRRQMQNKGELAVMVVCVVVGFLLAAQLRSVKLAGAADATNASRLETLQNLYNEVVDQKDGLADQVKQLQGELELYREQAASGEAGSQALKAELEQLEITAGLTDVEGPGVTIILEDSSQANVTGNEADYLIHDNDLLSVINELRSAGAEAISCLTEPKWFLGSDQIFREIRQAVATPMLRKDFTVDPYQLYQARLMGADCVLLLCALLDTRTLADYLALCDDLGLAALVEAHDEKEVASAVAAGAQIIGGNNRNLGDFSVNLDNAARLRDRVPPGVLYVAESGVPRPADVAAVRAMGADGVLIGEALMRAKDKSAMLNQFRRSV